MHVSLCSFSRVSSLHFVSLCIHLAAGARNFVHDISLLLDGEFYLSEEDLDGRARPEHH